MGPVGAVDAARTLAEDVLFPAAMAIERAAVVPLPYLDALAEAGLYALYGLYGPLDAGGFDAAHHDAARVVEALGGASLTTAFIWIQHHSTVRAVRSARPALRDAWIAPLCRGTLRSGIAFAALRRPGPPAMVAEPAGATRWSGRSSTPPKHRRSPSFPRSLRPSLPRQRWPCTSTVTRWDRIGWSTSRRSPTGPGATPVIRAPTVIWPSG